MIGLAYLVAGAIYVVAMVFLVGWAWRFGRKVNRGTALAGAMLAFLSLYLPVFWDFIPTMVAHRYYCAKDAGIVIVKDPKQWVSEHAMDADTLRIAYWDLNRPTATKKPGGWKYELINGGVAQETRWTAIGGIWMSIERLEIRVSDIQTGATLMTVRDYRSGATLVSQTLRPQPNADSCATPSFVLQSINIMHPLYLQDKSQ
ncbi:hypothetical protein [Niveibacterium sp.]|uniref:hypothetical protein n=1 Tax=Niveibacterium sp. TaxID=2017444 RepID=UPI0035B33C30